MTKTATAPVAATGCCPRFEPAAWDEADVRFEDRRFVKDRVRSLFHVPLNFGRVMQRSIARIDAAGARDPEMLTLTDEDSPWGSDVYISVSKEVPGATNVRLSGNYICRVFEGPYKDIRKWMQQMRDYAAAHGKQLKRLLVYYTTCPKCAKVYGRNYVVLLGEH